MHGGCAVQQNKPDPTKVFYDDETKTFIKPPEEDEKDMNLLSCAQFECLWLSSQKHEDETKRQPRHFRPDQTHVVLGPQDREDEKLLYVQVDPAYPRAWQDQPVSAYLNDLLSRGGQVELIIGDAPRLRLEVPFE